MLRSRGGSAPGGAFGHAGFLSDTLVLLWARLWDAVNVISPLARFKPCDRCAGRGSALRRRGTGHPDTTPSRRSGGANSSVRPPWSPRSCSVMRPSQRVRPVLRGALKHSVRFNPGRGFPLGGGARVVRGDRWLETVADSHPDVPWSGVVGPGVLWSVHGGKPGVVSESVIPPPRHIPGESYGVVPWWVVWRAALFRRGCSESTSARGVSSTPTSYLSESER